MSFSKSFILNNLKKHRSNLNIFKKRFVHILSLLLANSKLSWSNRKTFCLLFVCPFTRKSCLWCGLGLPKVTSFYWSLELKVCQFETYYLIHLNKDLANTQKNCFMSKNYVFTNEVIQKSNKSWYLSNKCAKWTFSTFLPKFM